MRGTRLNAATNVQPQCHQWRATGGSKYYFIDCNLSNAQWPDDLLDSRLRKVCLERVDLRSSNLHGLRSEGSNSKEIYLEHALMTRCNLREDLASG